MNISGNTKGVYELQVHDHACLIYDSEQEWRDAVVPFIFQGLKRGEKCVYAFNQSNRLTIINTLKSAGIDVDFYEDSQQLMILGKESLPEENQLNRLDQVQAFYIQFIEQAVKEGYPAVRFTGEALYTMGDFEPYKNMVEVNSRMNNLLFPYYPCVALCQYNRSQTDPVLLKYVIISHPIIIKNGRIYKNNGNICNEQEMVNDRWEAEFWMSIIERENLEREKIQQVHRLIVENAYDLVTIIDPQTNTYKYLSPSHERVVGYTAEELMGNNCFAHMHPEDQSKVKGILQEGLKKGGGSAQYRSHNKDGDYIWLEATGRIIEQDGYQGDILLVTRDITEKKLAEMERERSEEKYRLIVDIASDGISIVDATSFLTVYQNPALLKMLGYSRKEWPSKTIFDMVHPDDLVVVFEAATKGLVKGEGTVQCRVEKSDGTYIWLEINSKQMKKDQAHENRKFILILRDISQRKKAEEALIASESLLRRSQQELKQQLDYLNYLINTMDDIFVTYDLNRCMTLVNNAVYFSLGYTVGELLGRDVLDIIADHEIDRMTEYTKKRLIMGEAGIFETSVKRKNGSHALVRIKSSPITKNGVITGVMLLLEDISETRKIEREMARMDQLNTIGEMAAGIGHEIRNPMTTVKGFLQILSQQEDLKQHQHYFNLMLEELDRANDIISEFLSLAKNKLVDLKPGNLNDIINAIFPLLQADATLGDKSIVLDLHDIPALLLDEKEIRQLVINLVRNGLEAMSDGGTVSIITYLEADEVVLVVKDEGEGIRHEIMEQLGKPFISTKEKGTGLGLAICYSIAARHKARILPVSSSKGTSFIIRFKKL